MDGSLVTGPKGTVAFKQSNLWIWHTCKQTANYDVFRHTYCSNWAQTDGHPGNNPLHLFVTSQVCPNHRTFRWYFSTIREDFSWIFSPFFLKVSQVARFPQPALGGASCCCRLAQAVQPLAEPQVEVAKVKGTKLQRVMEKWVVSGNIRPLMAHMIDIITITYTAPTLK